MFKNMCLFIPMTHSKKNMKWLPKKIHVSSKCFCIFPPPFLSGFTALSEQEPGHPLLRNFQESPPAGQGAWAPRLVCLAASPQRWSEIPGSGCGSESVQGIDSEQVQAAPTDLSLATAPAFLGIILPQQNDFQCYFLT